MCNNLLSEEIDTWPGGKYTCRVTCPPGVRRGEARVNVPLLGTRHPLTREDLLDLPQLDDVVLPHGGQQASARVKVQMLHHSPIKTVILSISNVKS